MSALNRDRYRQLWLAGSTAKITIPLSSYKEANNLRLRLYNFAKPFRNDLESDPELSRILEGTEIVVREASQEGKWELWIRPEWQNETMIKAMEAIGVTLGPVTGADESLERIKKRLGLAEGLSLYDDDNEG